MLKQIRRYVLILFVVPVFPLHSQELNCNVQVVTNQIQGTNKQIYQTLQKSIYEFINNRNWTQHVYSFNERIECNILINIQDEISAGEFKASIQVQSRRPIYNSNYNTVILNLKDDNFNFRYVEFESLDFAENSFTSNLTSVLAYYAYLIIGFDYDTYGMEGGTPYFQKAETIVSNAQSSPDRGWKPFDGKNNRNRYWVIENILNDKYRPVRQFMYRYHRQGLDLMDQKVNEARATITESIRLLQNTYRQKPDPFMYYMQLILEAKRDEIANIFSESFQQEKSRVVEILKEIDPSSTSKYEEILSNPER